MYVNALNLISFKYLLICKKAASAHPKLKVSSSYGKQNYTDLCIFQESMHVFIMTGSLQPYRGGAQLRQCKAPHTALPRGLYSYPEWPSLQVKQQSQLTRLAPNTQETITSKSPDFRNPTLHQNSILKLLQCTIKQGKDYKTKRIFYDNGKPLPLAVPCTWEWKGSSNSWPYCSSWLQ